MAMSYLPLNAFSGNDNTPRAPPPSDGCLGISIDRSIDERACCARSTLATMLAPMSSMVVVDEEQEPLPLPMPLLPPNSNGNGAVNISARVVVALASFGYSMSPMQLLVGTALLPIFYFSF